VIYDTMTVYDNLAFPLRNRKVPEGEVRARVHEVADMLELTPDLGRRARRLAADAKQRISMGRGLVRSDVAAILFDEPLTTIDPHLKWQLRRKLKQIHERYRLTLVYVTHDQNEALTFADQVVVMNEGRVLQMGTPQELFEAPSHTFVGYFIGSPGMNFLDCELAGENARIAGHEIRLAPGAAARARARNGPYKIGVRPEYLRLNGAGGDNTLPVTIVEVENLGNFQMAAVRLDGQTVNVKLREGAEVPAERGYLTFDPAVTRLYADDELVH
jgi:glycerol transport system ATP-binding protein